MKLIITTITIFFISFGANAEKVGTLYDYCSKFKANNFKFNGLNKIDAISGGICLGTISAYIDAGVNSCNFYRYLYELSKEQNTLSDDVENMISVGVNMLANANMKKKQGILNFLNWAEKNPNKFDEFGIQNTFIFLSKPFPCNYKKAQ